MVGGTTVPMRSRAERRANRKAGATVPSKPHQVVASPPAKASADGLSPHRAEASFVPRLVVVAPPPTNALANASSSSVVAGATALPAKRPNPVTALAKPRAVVVPSRRAALAKSSSSPPSNASVRLRPPAAAPPANAMASASSSSTMLPGPAGESRACEVAPLSAAADEPPRKEARLESSLLTPAALTDETLAYYAESMLESDHRRENDLSDDDTVDDAENLVERSLLKDMDCSDLDGMLTILRQDADLNCVRSLPGFRDMRYQNYFVQWLRTILVEAQDKEAKGRNEKKSCW